MEKLLDQHDLKRHFRYLSDKKHPVLSKMGRDAAYDSGKFMAPGGLYLGQLLANALGPVIGRDVLDLGCGRGQSSLLLLRQGARQVVGVDLWIAPEDRKDPPTVFGCDTNTIKHIQTDFRSGLPYPPGAFDMIFALQAFHVFRGSKSLLEYTRSLLKTGGKIGIAQTCFNHEPNPIPDVFLETDGWDAGYESYHSPDWWKAHFEEGVSSPHFMGHFEVGFPGLVGACPGPDAAEHDCIA